MPASIRALGLGTVFALAGCWRCGPTESTDAGVDAAIVVDALDAGSGVEPFDLRNAAPDERTFRALTPRTGAVVATASVVFTWTGGAGRLELAHTREFAPVARTVTGEQTATARELARGVWFWRVVATDGATTTPRPLRVTGNALAVARQGRAYGSDINGDGVADLVFSQSVLVSDRTHPRAPGHVVSVARSDCNWGQPGLQPSTRRCWSKNNRLAEIGDLDGDGYDDLAHGDVVWRGRMSWPTTGALEPSGFLSLGKCLSIEGDDFARLGDLDGDGYADFALPRMCEGRGGDLPRCRQWTVLRGGARGTVRAGVTVGPYREVVGGGDVDGDGWDDLVALTGEGTVALHRGGPSGIGAEPQVVLPVGGKSPGCQNETEQFAPRPRLSMLDVDGDGLSDVVVLTGEADHDTTRRDAVTILLGGTSPALRPGGRFTWTEPSHFPELRIAALENAGAPPMLAIFGGGMFANDAYFLPLQRGKGASSPLYEHPYDVGDGTADSEARAVGDINGDGLDDLLLTMHEDLGIQVYYEAILGKAGGPKVLTRANRWLWVDDDDDGLTTARPPEQPAPW